jgi:hypothetical protein
VSGPNTAIELGQNTLLILYSFANDSFSSQLTFSNLNFQFGCTFSWSSGKCSRLSPHWQQCLRKIVRSLNQPKENLEEDADHPRLGNADFFSIEFQGQNQ